MKYGSIVLGRILVSHFIGHRIHKNRTVELRCNLFVYLISRSIYFCSQIPGELHTPILYSVQTG